MADPEPGLLEAHISKVNPSVPFGTYLDDLKTIGEVTALVAEASTAGDNAAFLVDGQSGDTDFPYIANIKPIATVGEYDAVTGYPLTGYPDGHGAWLLDESTLRVAYQSESYATMGNETYPWKMANGATFTGSHIHTIDYDREKFAGFLGNDTPASDMVLGSGHLFDTVYNVFGELVVPKSQGGKWGNQCLPDGTVLPFQAGMQLSQADFFFHSFCGAWYEKANRYGEGIGFADDVWMVSEEWNFQSRMFSSANQSANTMGLASIVVDIANGVAYTAPALGQTGYEKLMPLNPGHQDYVVVVCAGYNYNVEPAPLKVYIGKKGVDASGQPLAGSENARDQFLGRNGLLYGKLYGIAVLETDLSGSLGILSPSQGRKLMDEYVLNSTASDTFDAKYFPTSFQWAGWDNPVGVENTEMNRWVTESPAESGYLFFNGDTKTEHPALDPDLTQHRYIQCLTDEGALLAVDFYQLSQELEAAGGALPASVSAKCRRIVGAWDGALPIDTGGKGLKPDGSTQATDRSGRAKATSPDGLAWIKAADADILIVDEDSGNSGGDRKYALPLDPETLALASPGKGYFLAMAGGSANPRAAAKVSTYGKAYSASASAEFSSSWNVSALVALKAGGAFYSLAELAGSKEWEINQSLSLEETVLLGVVQHAGESGGPIADFRCDHGGQVFLYSLRLPVSTAAVQEALVGATELGGGWYADPAKGQFYHFGGTPWLYHRGLGYLYPDEGTSWYYSPDTGLGWLLIDNANVNTETVGNTQVLSGFVYADGLGAWVYTTAYDDGEGSTIIVFDTLAGTWYLLRDGGLVPL